MRLLHVHLLAGWLVALALPGEALSDQQQMLGGAVHLEAEAEAREALQQFLAVEARLKALHKELSSPDRERTIEEFRSEDKALRQEAAKLEERIRAAHRRRDRSILDAVQSRSLVLAGTGTGNAVLERLYSGLIAQTDPQRGTSFPPQLFYEANGTDEGVQKLIARRAEAAVLDRPLRGEERDALQRAFPDPGKQPLEKAFASAVLVIVVHARNPIRALTVTETKKIYRGEIDNWADVGSCDRNITRVGTKYPTLSWWMFSDQILGNESIRFRDQPFPEPGEPLLWKDMREWYADRQTRFPGGGPFPRYEDDAKVIEEVSKSPNAIGYCILLPADQKPKGVRIVPIAAHEDEPPIAPTQDRIVLDEYPLHQALWFLVSPDASAAGKALVEFACSEQAIATIRQCGLHPLTERPQMLAARRMDQFRMGHGVPVSVSGPDATQLSNRSHPGEQ